MIMFEFDSMLDLFDPMSIIHTLMYQARIDSDCWEERHIRAMINVCEYIKDVYPNMYDKVEYIHKRFLVKMSDY
jgi:hypothetical protein